RNLHSCQQLITASLENISSNAATIFAVEMHVDRGRTFNSRQAIARRSMDDEIEFEGCCD
ncbi:MAG TPA: hypothetical protein VIB00_04430, partial [Pyrinomonadaceae bacterium]